MNYNDLYHMFENELATLGLDDSITPEETINIDGDINQQQEISSGEIDNPDVIRENYERDLDFQNLREENAKVYGAEDDEAEDAEYFL